jgi:Flp pilus assembly protein TadG
MLVVFGLGLFLAGAMGLAVDAATQRGTQVRASGGFVWNLWKRKKCESHAMGLAINRRRHSKEGQALIEFALVLPLLMLLVLNVVNFGAMLYAMVTVANAARAGAQYTIMGGSYAHRGSRASFATVAARVYEDVSTLSDSSSKTVVKVCYNNNGTYSCWNCTNSTTCGSSTSGTSPNDPENTGAVATFLVGSVDVTYSYTPFVGALHFGNFYLTTPPTSIHRQGVMRAF